MPKMILMKMMNMKLKKIEIENIYIDAQDDIDEDDEYEAEEDLAPELPKEVNRKNDFDNMMRPYSAMPAKNNRIAISAKDKNY